MNFAILLGERHIGAVSVCFEEDAGELGWILTAPGAADARAQA